MNQQINGESTKVLDNIPDYYVPSKITHLLHSWTRLACFIFVIINNKFHKQTKAKQGIYPTNKHCLCIHSQMKHTFLCHWTHCCPETVKNMEPKARMVCSVMYSVITMRTNSKSFLSLAHPSSRGDTFPLHPLWCLLDTELLSRQNTAAELSK